MAWIEGHRINDSDREDWVENDEGLYDLMYSSHVGIKLWVPLNRELIDEVIGNVLSSRKHPHYLKYGEKK